jgi:hypothetical protein
MKRCLKEWIVVQKGHAPVNAKMRRRESGLERIIIWESSISLLMRSHKPLVKPTPATQYLGNYLI